MDYPAIGKYTETKRRWGMLRWALIFFIVAILAAVFGFGELVVGLAADVAKFLFFIFLVLLVGSLVLNYTRRPRL